MMDGHNGVETLLCRAASQVLKRDEHEINPEKSLAEQGGDMMSGVFFAGKCRELDLLVDIAQVSNTSIRDLARQLVESNTELQRSSNGTDFKSVSIPHTQLQNLYRTAGSTQGFTLDVEAPMSLADANKMLERLVERHPVLGASLTLEQKNLFVLSDITPSSLGTLVPFESEAKAIAQVRKLQQEASKSSQILSVPFFGEEFRIRKIGLVASTAAVDAYSWHVLLQEIQAYPIRSHGTGTQHHTFADWIERLDQEAFEGDRLCHYGGALREFWIAVDSPLPPDRGYLILRLQFGLGVNRRTS